MTFTTRLPAFTTSTCSVKMSLAVGCGLVYCTFVGP